MVAKFTLLALVEAKDPRVLVAYPNRKRPKVLPGTKSSLNKEMSSSDTVSMTALTPSSQTSKNN